MSSVIDKQLNEMSDLGEAQEMAMEAYGALCLTMEAYSNRELTLTTPMLAANHATIQAMLRPIGFTVSTLGMESYGDSRRSLAMEGILTSIANVIKAIIGSIISFFKWIGSLFGFCESSGDAIGSGGGSVAASAKKNEAEMEKELRVIKPTGKLVSKSDADLIVESVFSFYSSPVGDWKNVAPALQDRKEYWEGKLASYQAVKFESDFKTMQDEHGFYDINYIEQGKHASEITDLLKRLDSTGHNYKMLFELFRGVGKVITPKATDDQLSEWILKYLRAYPGSMLFQRSRLTEITIPNQEPGVSVYESTDGIGRKKFRYSFRTDGDGNNFDEQLEALRALKVEAVDIRDTYPHTPVPVSLKAFLRVKSCDKLTAEIGKKLKGSADMKRGLDGLSNEIMVALKPLERMSDDYNVNSKKALMAMGRRFSATVAFPLGLAFAHIESIGKDYLAYQKYLDGIYKAAMNVVRECNKEGASLEYK